MAEKPAHEKNVSRGLLYAAKRSLRKGGTLNVICEGSERGVFVEDCVTLLRTIKIKNLIQ